MGTSTGERSPPTARLMVRRYWAAAAISTTARDGRGAPGPPSSIPDVSELPSPPVRPAQTPERRIRRAWWIFATSFFILGLFAAIYQGSWFDRTVNVFTLMTISVPEYFLAYILIKYLTVQFGWFPSLANVPPDAGLGERLYLSFLPMLVLVLVVVAHMMRMTRASVLAVMSSPYIEMAFLKGLPKWRIVVQHALPNALAPIISVIALNLAYLIVGVVIVEAVFVYPGLGQLMVDAVSKHDVPVVQACGLIFAFAFIFLNMTADILAIMSNPRLRYPR